MIIRQWIRNAVALGAIAAFAACGSGSGGSDPGGNDTTGGDPTGNTSPPDTIGGDPIAAATSCLKNATLRLADCALLNNMHGEDRLAPGDSYEQCVSVAEGGFPASWRWDLETGQPYVKGFPQIYFGAHLWTGISTTDLLPARIVDIDSLVVRHDIALKVEGVHNVSFDLWVVPGPDPVPDGRTHEIMIWLSGNIPPGGDANERVTIDGLPYDFYRWTHHDGHLFLMFIARAPHLTGSTNIRSFLDYLSDTGDLDESLYLANIELGTEMWNGRGTVTIGDFHVTVKKR